MRRIAGTTFALGFFAGVSVWPEQATAVPLGTVFTYQGQLKSGGSPVNNTADFQFTLWDSAVGGLQLGGISPANNVTLVNGLFTAPVNAASEFGASAFNGDARWLAISLRTPAGSGPFVPLSGRQAVSVAPYALQTRGIFVSDALNVGIGDLTPAAKLTVGNGDKFQVSGADGDLTFTDDQASIIFSATDATNAPMMSMFATGSINGPRMVIAHSPAFTDFGLQYDDSEDKFHFLGGPAALGGGGIFHTMTVQLYVPGGSPFFIPGIGRVGINDTDPAASFTVGAGSKFQVSGSQGDVTFVDDGASITFPATDATNSPMMFMFASGIDNADRMVIAHGPANPTWGLQYRDVGDEFRFLQAGTTLLNVDLGNFGVGIGDITPGFLLDVNGRMRVRGGAGGSSAGLWLYQTTTANDRAFFGMFNDTTVGLWGNTGAGWQFGMNTTTGNVGIGTMAPATKLHVNGTARVNVIEILGADLAEQFPFSEEVEPGMVVSIDPKNPGKLRRAQGAYNRAVAGVIAGANDFSTGVVLGKNAESDGLNHPVALSGRVYVYCDATNAPIEPGDQLTTSDTPGHAMKVLDHDRAHGAVLGKAMSELREGKGMVLVLVTLQ